MSFFRQTSIEFAIFVGGMIFVVKRIAVLGLALVFVLVAFTQMFFILHHETAECPGVPWCEMGTSFLKVSTMFLRVIDADDWGNNTAATIVFVFFMIVAIIILANMLIAMVVDAYGVIKNERAHAVFWANRLDFVSEMIMLDSFQCKHGKGFKYNPARVDHDQTEATGNIGEVLWEQLMELYEDKNLDVCSVGFFFFSFCRLVAILVISLWLLIGFFPTAGLVWPQQVRKWLMSRQIDGKHDASPIGDDQDCVLIAEIVAEVSKSQENVKIELSSIKADVQKEMNRMKELVLHLIDMIDSE